MKGSTGVAAIVHRHRGRSTRFTSNLESKHMDDDLANLDRDALVAEVKRLRAGIRRHRDSTGHELCWHHPQLWGLLPESTDPVPAVPDWPQFLRGCLRYRESLDEQLPDAPRTHGEFTDTASRSLHEQTMGTTDEERRHRAEDAQRRAQGKHGVR
jgi:hypothetical protein